MALITGTNHFDSLWDAEMYYKKYAPSLTITEVRKWVQNKIKDKEIKIGKPELREGERLLFNQEEGRYFIEKGE